MEAACDKAADTQCNRPIDDMVGAFLDAESSPTAGCCDRDPADPVRPPENGEAVRRRLCPN